MDIFPKISRLWNRTQNEALELRDSFCRETDLCTPRPTPLQKELNKIVESSVSRALSGKELAELINGRK